MKMKLYLFSLVFICFSFKTFATTPNKNIVETLNIKAEQGDMAAQNTLGYMYIFGKGVPKDYTKAIKYLNQAASQGDTSAQDTLGDMYRKNQGLPKIMRDPLNYIQNPLIKDIN